MFTLMRLLALSAFLAVAASVAAQTNTVTLAWDSPMFGSYDSYTLYGSTNPSFTANLAAAPIRTNVGLTRMASVRVPSSGVWYFAATARNAAGESLPSNLVIYESQTSVTLPPTALVGSRVGPLDIALTWTASPSVGVSDYIIYGGQTVSFTNNMAAATLVKPVGSPLTSTTLSAPAAGVWFFVVTAKVPASGESKPSNMTKVDTTATPLNLILIPPGSSVVLSNASTSASATVVIKPQ